MFDSLQLYGPQLARLLCPWDSPGKNTEGFPSPGDLPHPGTELVSLMSPAMGAGSLPLAPSGKSKFSLNAFHTQALTFFWVWISSLSYLGQLAGTPV